MEHSLTAYRKANGLSCEDLAQLVGVCRQSIYRIERWQQQPSLSTIRKLVAVTGGAVSADDFLGQDAAE